MSAPGEPGDLDRFRWLAHVAPRPTAVTIAVAAVLGSLLAGGALVGLPAPLTVPVGLVVFLLVVVRWEREMAGLFPPDLLGSPPPAASGAVRVRPLRPDDAAAYVAAVDDEAVRRNGWPTFDAALTRRAIAAHQPWGRVNRLAICVGDEDRLVGWMTVEPAEGGTVELGMLLGPRARGRGLAADAIRAAMTVLGGLGHSHAVLATAEDNAPMVAAAETAGGTLVRRGDRTLADGRVVASRWYELRATET